MSVKSLQGRRTTYATRIKLMKLKVQNTTVKTNDGKTCDLLISAPADLHNIWIVGSQMYSKVN